MASLTPIWSERPLRGRTIGLRVVILDEKRPHECGKEVCAPATVNYSLAKRPGGTPGAMSSLRTRPCEDAIIQSTSAAVPSPADAKPWVLISTILASSIANIDESIINVALPAIETDLAT